MILEIAVVVLSFAFTWMYGEMVKARHEVRALDRMLELVEGENQDLRTRAAALERVQAEDNR